MIPPSKIVKFTQLEADFFRYDAGGDLPFAITIAIHPFADNVVKITLDKITDFCTVFNHQNSNIEIRISYEEVTEIFFGSQEDMWVAKPNEELEIMRINPDTLILILRYTENREKVITLELADNIEKFTMH